VKKLSIVVGALMGLAVPGLAADDPIAVRQALMYNNGSAAAVAGGVLKGELPYSPPVGRAVINAWQATALAVGDFFPEGSGTGGATKTAASPKIWEDAAGFQAALDKFRTAAAAALQASGENGPPDQAAFKTAVEPVLGTCKNCHDTYRLEDEQ
jgi:cytochrome c556